MEIGNPRAINLRRSGRREAGRGPYLRQKAPPQNKKICGPNLRAQSAEICDQQKTSDQSNPATKNYHSLRDFFGRRFTQIENADRAQIFFIEPGAVATQIGTSACFAAAGFPQIATPIITSEIDNSRNSQR